MTGRLLARGLLAGLLAGALALAFALIWGEPHINAAIAIEEAQSAAEHLHGAATPAGHHHGDEEEELVSRATQASWGLATGMLVHGAALGGLFALVFALVQGRVATTGMRMTALLLALAGFVAITLVPQLKYPANPPAVGDGDTIGLRTALFFGLLVLSILTVVIGVAVARRLRPLGAWRAGLAGTATWLALTGAALLVLPTIDEVPPDFPAEVLHGFRLATLGVQAILWAVLGLTFGLLAERLLDGPPRRMALQH